MRLGSVPPRPSKSDWVEDAGGELHPGEAGAAEIGGVALIRAGPIHLEGILGAHARHDVDHRRDLRDEEVVGDAGRGQAQFDRPALQAPPGHRWSRYAAADRRRATASPS